MSAESFVCRGCSRQLAKNPRLAGREQGYCKRRRCQQLRRSRWQRKRVRANSEYRAEQRAAEKLARQKDAGYYSKYRERHPEQLERNRLLQAERDRRRRAKAVCLPATVDGEPALPVEQPGSPPGAGRYRMQPLDVAGAPSFEVVLTPAEVVGSVLATMDSILAREAALGAASRG